MTEENFWLMKRERV